MNRFKLDDNTPKPSKRPKHQSITELEMQELIESGAVNYVNYDTGVSVSASKTVKIKKKEV